VRYRVNCIGTHQTTGTVLGSGLGEASSGEEKYKWRKAVNHEEWEETPPNMRRKKHARGKGGTFYVQEQVRTEPADLANTVLKMANKRAKMAMVLNVTAASDCFSQDLEDMDDALRDHLARHERRHRRRRSSSKPSAKCGPTKPSKSKLPKMLKAIANGKKPEEIIAWAESKGALTEQQKARIHGGNKAAADTAAAPTFAQGRRRDRQGLRPRQARHSRATSSAKCPTSSSARSCRRRTTRAKRNSPPRTDAMKTHNHAQGSESWHAHRAQCFNASDAAGDARHLALSHPRRLAARVRHGPAPRSRRQHAAPLR
jgi:hypothetical protein